MKIILSTLAIAVFAATCPTPVKADTVLWSDYLGTLNRMNPDGTGQSELYATLNDPLTSPRSLATDGSYLYYSTNLDAINRVSLADPFAIGESLVGVNGVEDIAVYGDSIYYTTWTGGVFRANKDGTGGTNLIPGGSSGFLGIYVADGSIYFTNRNNYTLYKCDLNGGSLNAIYTNTSNAMLADVCVTGSNVYIADSLGHSNIIKTDLNGDTATSIGSGAFGAISISGDSLYYENLHTIGRMNLDGTEQTILYSNSESSPSGIVAADVVPEPSSFVLLGLGAAGLAMLRRKPAHK